jgi:hypothetical protein
VLAGAVFGVLLTRLGKLVAGAPDASLANYAWNAAAFGLIAGIVSPIVSWAALRRVPLWSTVAEPLVWAVAGGAAAVILGVPALILVLPPVGLVLGFGNLRRRYPDGAERLSGRSAFQDLPSPSEVRNVNLQQRHDSPPG